MADWLSSSTESLSSLEAFGRGVLEFLPLLIAALIVFIIGWLISAGVGKLFEGILKKLQLDKLFKAKKWDQALEKAEFSGGPSEFIGGLIKWILIIVFLSISVEILGLTQFGYFLNETVLKIWIPNILAAILIFVATVIVAGFAEKLIKASLHGAKVEHGKLGATIVKWLIWVFGISAILVQFNIAIADEVVTTIFGGIVAFIVIAGGLAFGLGGKEVAADILKGLRNKLR